LINSNILKYEIKKDISFETEAKPVNVKIQKSNLIQKLNMANKINFDNVKDTK